MKIKTNLRIKKALLDKSVKDERKEMMKRIEKDIRYIEEYKLENKVSHDMS